jgi:hypothetical protein
MFYIVKRLYRASDRDSVYFIIKCPKKYKIVEKLKWYRPFFPDTFEKTRCASIHLSSITRYVYRIPYKDYEDLMDKWMSGRELEEKIRRILEKLFEDKRIVEKRMKRLKEFMRKKIEDFEREKYEKSLPYVRRFDYSWYIGSLKRYILTSKSLMTLILSTPYRHEDVYIKLLKKFFAIEEYDPYSSDVILIELPYNTSIIKPEFVNDRRVEEVIKEDLLRELEEMRDEINMNDEQKQYFEKAVQVIKYLVTLKEILSA